MIEADLIINRKQQAHSTELGNELIIMHIESGNYITLNKIGGVIWDLLENPMSISDLVSNLLVAYEVDESVCRKETLAFIEKLKECHLIELSQK